MNTIKKHCSSFKIVELAIDSFWKKVFSISKLLEEVGVWPNLYIVLDKCIIYGKMYDVWKNV